MINEKLETLKYALNNYLTAVYKVSRKGIDSFIKNYQPFHWWAEFFDIINSGGFDVVIGNPPYVEYSKVKTKYKVHGFSTEVCGNLFVFVMERSYLLLKNRASFGMIVPISLTAAQRMATLQSLLYQIGGTVYLSNYALRPAALFPGIMQRLSICISCKGDPQELFTTEYITWYAEERPVLFNKIFYHNLNNLRLPYSIPKVNNRIAYNCLKKILDCGRHWNSYREMEGKFSLFYHNAGGYWIKTFDYKPFYKSLENSQKNHTTITELRLASKEYSVVYLALLNSSTYYFFWKTITDARHLYPSDIAQFPIKFPFEGALFEKLDKLTHQLMESFKNNSHRIIYGKAEVDQVNVLPSKPIIDEIDKVLAAHYGFTEEELDFIINYDIKYRMGKDTEEGEE
ncbi:MAG: Eco57I restriction-modification methylase domain-containing protein [Ignavibacteriaceae bacterium]|nr:Eco57I restriction-modification methylase domain-containing protein [Ignavibacteriaceae bacterium]